MRAVLAPKLAGESKNYSFTFSLTAGVTISSAVCTVTVYSGTDASPSSILSGSSSVAGAAVIQRFIGGTVGVIYEVLCEATLSSTQVLSQSAYLAVVPNLG